MKFGIQEEALDKIVRVLATAPKVERVILYGSRAKGTFRAGSDIDLCLEAPDLDYQALLHLENELDDLLLAWKIDLALKHRIDNPELRSHIDRMGKVVFKRVGGNV